MTQDKGDDIIDLLTSQTFDLAEARSTLVQFPTRTDCEKGSLLESLQDNRISFWDLKYDIGRQSFRLQMGDEVMDFPRNWSIFGKLFSSWQNGESCYLTLNKNDDGDQLYSILNHLFAAEQFYFVCEKNELMLIADCYLDSRIKDLLQEFCAPPLPSLMAA